MISLENLIFFSMLTWRITVLLTFDSGPGNILVRFRSIIGVVYDEYSNRHGKNWVADMLNCHFCSSLWVGWIVALLWQQDWSFVIVGMVLSAGSLIVDSIKPTV